MAAVLRVYLQWGRGADLHNHCVCNCCPVSRCIVFLSSVLYKPKILSSTENVEMFQWHDYFCSLLTGKKKSIKKTIHENQVQFCIFLTELGYWLTNFSWSKFLTIQFTLQSPATPVMDIAPPVYPREFPRKTKTLPAHVSPLQSCTYDTPPIRVRVTSLRDRSSAGRHPVSQGPTRRCHDRQELEDVKEVEEENPLIYATLNHKAAPQRPVRVTHVQIEASEYAAVKVT